MFKYIIGIILSSTVVFNTVTSVIPNGTTIYLDGVKQDIESYLIEGITYIPLRFIDEITRTSTKYDAYTKNAYIYSSSEKEDIVIAYLRSIDIPEHEMHLYLNQVSEDFAKLAVSIKGGGEIDNS